MDILGVPWHWYLLVLFWGLAGAEDRVCRGTTNGLHHTDDTDYMYQTYISLYSNCTFVDGNLEIVFLDKQNNYDLSFLEGIREVTGYVLIVSVFADYVPLTNLRIIRGRTLFEHEYGGQIRQYSLYVALNYKKNHFGVGLKELRFKSLQEIQKGGIFLYNNNMLCFDHTIRWDDIMVGEDSTITFGNDNVDPMRDCDTPCHPDCEDPGSGSERHCWGEGPEMCQRLTRVNCAKQCSERCFGQQPNECCHPECAGGCSGPYDTQCYACKNFKDNDTCVTHCPTEMVYDPNMYEWVPNPNAKYAYGTMCVETCPSYLVQDRAACVRECQEGRIAVNGKCVPCDGPCPKQCMGTGTDFVNSNNIDQYEGCTVINGNLMLIQTTITGDPHRQIEPLPLERLEVFSTVEKITQHLIVQLNYTGFHDLHFFRNLHTIEGQILDEYSSALHIYGTSLQSLRLKSLNRIGNGMVLIAGNDQLCFVDTIDWESIVEDEIPDIRILSNNDRCVENGNICNAECSSRGCWDTGNDMCLSCQNFDFERTCLSSCDLDEDSYQASSDMCLRCDPECVGGCNSSEANHCESCRNLQDGPYCVAACPPTKYPDDFGKCQPCHNTCEESCTGPLNHMGEGGCDSCAMALVNSTDHVVECVAHNRTCPDGYYRSYIGPDTAKKLACKPCNDLCGSCSGPYLTHCDTCKYLEQGQQCVDHCQINYYPNYAEKQCRPCHEQCRGCTGPSSIECKKCMSYKVYLDEEMEDSTVEQKFNCTGQCPSNLPFPQQVELSEFETETICTKEEEQDTVPIILGCVFGGVFILACLAAVLIAYFYKQRAKAQESTMKLTARMTGLDENEPLTPTDARPDMSLLRLIKESELRRGNIIGSGAFGTVYKGVWIPAGENVKIPVAIKVLQEGTPGLNKELLEEARIMTSVDHPCCVRILAVCMTAQMMLITQLMPLGCLLDYVRGHKDNIGSKALLNWCTQIARGMAYLEEKAIVHRDLAARNVLVQNPGQVKITDFGLAKLLEYEEEEYRSAGGKMPIKWLALECIQHRIFTHKSDVWSFGVTVWELFTYGHRPYENIRARDVPDLLEKGERLPQPSMCTIDVYMIMIKCWMLDAESRPSFRELAEEFAKMARDPGRYLVISGDKLMRLPSHTIDTKDLIRSMSVGADGPEVIMDAEDYLQPQPIVEPIANGKVNKMPDDEGYDDRDHGGFDRRHKDRYNKDRYNLEAAAAAKKLRTDNTRDSLHSRYSADPCKVIGGEKDLDIPTMLPPPTPTPLPVHQEEDEIKDFEIENKMPLPVDEDDYLQPKSSNPAAYMDLIDDYLPMSSPEKEKLDRVSPPLSLGMSPPSAIDNPEYFESSGTETTNLSELQAYPSRARSFSTDSSDPEYYNEYDKLNRYRKDDVPTVALENGMVGEQMV